MEVKNRILINLKTVPCKETLTMGGSNLKKLTKDDKKIAKDEGWELK